MTPGSSILVCSDGITNVVELPKIEEMLKGMDTHSFVHSVIDLANQNGGTDNSTAVCLKVSKNLIYSCLTNLFFSQKIRGE